MHSSAGGGENELRVPCGAPEVILGVQQHCERAHGSDPKHEQQAQPAVLRHSSTRVRVSARLLACYQSRFLMRAVRRFKRIYKLAALSAPPGWMASPHGDNVASCYAAETHYTCYASYLCTRLPALALIPRHIEVEVCSTGVERARALERGCERGTATGGERASASKTERAACPGH